MEKIKIVIWDLDDTFWRGTLSEGGIEPIQDNLDLIKHLVDQGIMNSICSKNDPAQAEEKLREIGAWDYFIFPCINWEPKGPQIVKLLDECSLRAENALFIDDNPQNLREAQYYSNKLNVLDAGEVAQLWDLKGNPDPDHERLQQYRVLESKKDAAARFSSNEDFLYASNVRVTMGKDCEKHAERLLDLINRSNQLNYTKVRLNGEELSALLADKNVDCGYVSVEDDFGEYGIVGFYAVENGAAKHFLFSCRTIGMGIEQYVYAKLGYPELQVVGEVRSELVKGQCPGWINREQSADEQQTQGQDRAIKSKLNVLVSGGCDLEQLAAYLKCGKSTIDYKFNVGIVRHDNTYYQIGALEYPEEVKKELADNLPFIKKATFDKSLFDEKYDVVVFSLLMDYTQNVYVSKKDPKIAVTLGDFKLPISADYCPEFMAGKPYEYLTENFVSKGRISGDDLMAHLVYLREHIRPDIPFILINGCEVPFEHKWETDRYLVHHEYNEVVDRFVASGKNVYLLDMRKIVTQKEQLADNIRHYRRDVFYRMAAELAEIINRATGSDTLTGTDKIGLSYKIKSFTQKLHDKLLK